MKKYVSVPLGAAALAACVALAPLASLAAAQVQRIGPVDSSGCTTDPAAATTVPGWITIEGSPALLCAEDGPVAGPHAEPGRIASGPYGSSALQRVVDLRAAAAAIDRGAASYALSGWLGSAGAGHAQAIVTMIFRDAKQRALSGAARLEGPVAAVPDGAGRAEAFTSRSASGAIPPGARSLELVLRFVNGDPAHDAAYADQLHLALTPPLALPRPRPPRARVPRFDHVFVVMMENTSFEQVIGDARDAPYINALTGRGALLARYFGVYHPSDENYLAVANGATAVRGAVYFPKIHLKVRHLGDTIEAAGKTWKAYEQGMGTPCNTTTRFDKYYEPDDAPFVNYANVIDDPRRCRTHLFDTKQLATDLAAARTTPSFAWIAADDYEDGEGAGNGSPQSLRVQNAWLERTLEPLFASPAWRRQRSLLILTWDESSTTAGNHVAAILLGSRGTVRRGFVSQVRYDHYSAGRTIEEALGLRPLTANDRYARAIDDVFAR